jgi:MarR family transcriptional regulator, transcriptional regulator for hemolysin
MKNRPITDLDNVLMYQLYRCGRLLRYYLQRFLDVGDESFTPEQYFLLYRLNATNGLTQRELADRVLNDHPNITRLIDKLENKGYVRREAGENDRRSFSITITEKGKKLSGRMAPVVARERERLLKGISPEEIRLVQSVLKKLESNMKK